MGWSHIPEFDYKILSVSPKLIIAVNLPNDKWLCKELDILNLTLVVGYPSKSSEAGALQRDQFNKTPRSQSKWYGLHSDMQAISSSVSYWLSWPVLTVLIAGLPALRPISQETLMKREKAAKESSNICNQAAGFNSCLTHFGESIHATEHHSR